jgi:hypothetical protein
VLIVPQPLAWTLDLTQILSLKASILLNSAALQTPVSIHMENNTLSVAPGQYSLPADSLNTLGAPFNTLKSTGQIALRWAAFEHAIASNTPPAVAISLTVHHLRMALTGDEALGDYMLDVKPSANGRWTLVLMTSNPAQAALLLKGSGQLGFNSPPQFELESKSATAQTPPRLQTLLNFLGRRQGDVYILKIN